MRQQHNTHTDIDRDDVLAEATLNAAAELGLTQEQLAAVLGRTKSRLRAAIRVDNRAGECGLLVVRIYRSLACQSELTPVHIAGGFTRVVESQEQVATTRLVNNVLDRQNVLETLLEQSKPKRVPGTEHLHYLLATPWRYPPLRYGSRFGQRTEPSLFYASFGVSTALAETAYYRWVFYGDMEVSIKGAVMSSHTSFESEYSANSGLRLQAPQGHA